MTNHNKLNQEYSTMKQEYQKIEDENNLKLQNKSTEKQEFLEKEILIKNEKIKFENEILRKDEKMKILQASLAASIAQCADLELIPRELKENILHLEDEIRNHKLECSLLNEEVKVLKKLVETLKIKVREMTGKDASFLDTFEEV